VFDLSIGKLLVIGVIALFLVGPDKLPQYAAVLGRWVRAARAMADQAKQRVASEMGPEFEDVDWASLDPRRYHPRRLLMDAWNAAPEGRAPEDAGPERELVAVPMHDDAPDLLALAEERALATDAVRAS
jgi:sec-independent protein translocase protein TatB